MKLLLTLQAAGLRVSTAVYYILKRACEEASQIG
jgi:hypothetical protein